MSVSMRGLETIFVTVAVVITLVVVTANVAVLVVVVVVDVIYVLIILEGVAALIFPKLSISAVSDLGTRNPLRCCGASLGLNAFHVHDPLEVDDHEA